jgi:small subunit ribosomal protein S6
MSKQPPLYDLMLLLSTGPTPEERAKLVAEVEGMITSGGGSIVHKGEWGTRAMTYQINHQAEAEYHLRQFTGPTAVLDALGHSLRINDDVLRFRIIKVIPGTPPPPEPGPVVAPTAPVGVASRVDAEADE